MLLDEYGKEEKEAMKLIFMAVRVHFLKLLRQKGRNGVFFKLLIR